MRFAGYLLLIALSSIVSLSPAGSRADETPSTAVAPASAPAEEVIVVEPQAGTPAIVHIGTPRPDGTGRQPGQMIDFQLTDQLGRTVTRETLLGRPWVANFIFSNCPSHCPATLREIYELQRRLKDVDVRFVTITVDPANDTVAKLLELSKAFGADPEKWLFLTGDVAEIQRLVMDGFQQTMVANPMQLAHSLNLMHVDAAGRVIGKYRYHFQEPDGPDQLNRLRQVLLGQIETPEENRFVPAPPVAEAQDHPEEASGTEPTAEAPSQALPPWVDRLRSTNAMLNGLATVLLLAGLGAIRAGSVTHHKRLMLTAFAVSVAFLACYLTYHGALRSYTGVGHKPYAGAESLRQGYYAILGTHVVLAALVPVLAVITIRRGLKDQREAHRRIARVTFPIWLYVSVTGVIIYFMNAA